MGSEQLGVDVVVVGDGVLGRSIAYALATADGRPEVVLCGRTGPAASPAAGAMLGVLGEVTGATLAKPHSVLRLEMAVEAAGRWPSWREGVRLWAAAAATDGDGYGTGTFMLLNAVSARLDEKAFAAVRAAGDRYGLPVEDVEPGDVPGYRPLDNDRALRALYLPDEGFLDARRWLTTLDAALNALPNVTRTGDGRLSATAAGYNLHSVEGVVTAPVAVVAAGAWTTQVLAALDPGPHVMPVLSVAGTALTASAPAPLPAVLRTPNRAYACGLHTVPQADGTWYVGASAAPAMTPGAAATAGGLRSLLDSALGQLHHGLATSAVHRIHHGNRPIGLDGHPLLGPTTRPGLWVATGTHREGLHTSPLIAQELADAVLNARPSRWLAPWRPDRAPLTDWTAEEATREAADHHHALTAESRMRPPLTGSWPEALQHAYQHRLSEVYAAMPAGYVLPPDLAPLGYEHREAIAAVARSHLQRLPAQATAAQRYQP
ncbi:FAD-dependent oxidoreductase [Streptomyces gobitricini]|uniref:NAD(P)/FAD-dependent oxidoreductase n=1 Tax=Streptomyces gobitricini TaxID=68211 RepID=UPI0031D2E63F